VEIQSEQNPSAASRLPIEGEQENVDLTWGASRPESGHDVPLGRLLRSLMLALALAPLVAGAAELPGLAVLPFELIDEQHELAPAHEEYARLPVIAQQLSDGLRSNGLYRVLDTTPVRPMIDDLAARQNLRDCNGCELEIGKALGADRVLVGWVQKVSNLILNINVRIEDVSSGATVLQKSVDIRGNTDDSWRRGVDALVRDMVEKGQRGR
jgi:hypothetical protein